MVDGSSQQDALAPGKKPQSAADKAGAGAGTESAAEVLRIIHQFNQPLTAISNYAQAGSQLLDQGLDDTGQLKELFEKIIAQCNRTFVISQELGKAVTRQGIRPEDAPGAE